MKPTKKFLQMILACKKWQEEICSGIALLDDKDFGKDVWKKEGVGEGVTQVLCEGSIFEKAGVGFSNVCSKVPESLASFLKLKAGETFFACGLSLIIHPFSPHIPTIHMNVRYFETQDTFWYGGGIDLTPYYPHKEDFLFFHQSLKAAVSQTHKKHYEQFKTKCDNYFTLPHRGEMRGVGGIFFDGMKDEKSFLLSKNITESFLPIYKKIVLNRKNTSFNEAEKSFQLWRRGRYVEFNLLYDKGTLFGLKTGGRIESIMMSMPSEVRFVYNRQVKQGTFEEEMMRYYKPQKWD